MFFWSCTTVQNIHKVCSIYERSSIQRTWRVRTLFRGASRNPANSFVFASTGRAGPSPMMLCSSCVKSFLCARERAELRHLSLIPPSSGSFFPTDAQTLSASTFAWNTHMDPALRTFNNRDVRCRLYV